MSRREHLVARGLTHGRRRLSSKNLSLESLENRIVLAAPQFVSVQPNGGDVLSPAIVDVLESSPRSLTVRFDQELDGSAQSLAGVQVLNDGVPVENISRDLGLIGSTVVLRFAETLPDDTYTINVTASLLSATGEAFVPASNPSVPLNFELDQGSQVAAVVPQPITRGDTGLSQALDQIEVYFSSSDVDPVLAEDPAYYRLILTEGTVHSTDDTAFQPTDIAYVADEGKVVLTFADSLDALAGGSGTFRLRIGTNESGSAGGLVEWTVNDDPEDSYDSAFDLGALATGSQIVRTEIDQSEIAVFSYNFKSLYGGKNEVQQFSIEGATAGTFTIAFEGEQTVDIEFNATPEDVQAALELLPNIGPGNVLVTGEVLDDGTVLTIPEVPLRIEFVGDLEEMPLDEITIDSTNLTNAAVEIETIKQGFVDTFANLITEAQKQRVREAYEIISAQFGVDVVETEDIGVTVATGSPDLAGDDDIVVSNSVNWNDEFLAVSQQGFPSFLNNF